MRLERRLIGLSLGVLLLGVVLQLALLLVYEQTTYRDRILQDLKGRTQILGLNSAAAIEFNDATAANENLQTLKTTPAVVLACLYDGKHVVLASYSPLRLPCPAINEALESSAYIRHFEVIRVQNQVVGGLLLQERLPDLWQRLPRYSLLLLSAISVETLLILVLVLALRARVIAPVNQLAQLAERVTEAQDYRQRVQVSGRDEISALGNSVNRMLSVIEERELALKDSSRLLQALIDHAPATITIKAPDGRYRLVNEMFAQLVAREASELPGLDDTAVFPPELAASRQAFDQQVLVEGTSQRHEETLGGKTWLTERFPLLNTRGELYAICAIATDISEQRATQASLANALSELTHLNESLEERVVQRTLELQQAMGQLIQSEKLAALGSLVAGVAHELNTPIGMVVTVSSSLSERVRQFSSLLAESKISRSALQQFFDDVQQGMTLVENNSLRAGQLISNFKQVAVDQTSMRRRVFRLDELIGETLHALVPLFKHTPHHVETAIPEDIQCDSFPGAVEQILTNLIQNALLHGLAEQAQGVVYLSAKRWNGSVELEIRDTGCGIPAEHLPRIFDPFFTTRLGAGGSGLGLYIVHNLATAVLGGEIEARNSPEGGAVFRLRFPLQAPQKS